MKSLVVLATLAALSVSIAVPLQAATKGPALTAAFATLEIDRQGRGCDTAHDIAQKPRCARP